MTRLEQLNEMLTEAILEMNGWRIQELCVEIEQEEQIPTELKAILF